MDKQLVLSSDELNNLSMALLAGYDNYDFYKLKYLNAKEPDIETIKKYNDMINWIDEFLERVNQLRGYPDKMIRQHRRRDSE